MLLEIVGQTDEPVLRAGDPGTGDNRFGFEGGRVLRHGGRLHLFVSEMCDEPRFVKSRLAHWTSETGERWHRETTLFESTGDFTGTDPRAAIFLPQPVWNQAELRWNLFYAAFRSKPNSDGQWLLNHDGVVWRAASETAGQPGLAGPYRDVEVVLQRDQDADPWEGLQGTDSFFPYQVGDEWYAFYGSAHTQKWPCDFWGIGLARAARLSGTWRRCSELNPVPIDSPFIENPSVMRLSDGRYLMVYDAVLRGKAIGVSVSTDGVSWAKGERLELDGRVTWLKQTRTPLGLVAEDDRTYQLYFTGEDFTGYRVVGRLQVRLCEP